MSAKRLQWEQAHLLHWFMCNEVGMWVRRPQGKMLRIARRRQQVRMRRNKLAWLRIGRLLSLAGVPVWAPMRLRRQREKERALHGWTSTIQGKP